MNPHYNADQMGWESVDFSEPNLSYEFNYLCFWKTPKGLVFSASDRGCSCPTPFESYEAETAVEIEQKLERVENFDHAKRIFEGWNKDYSGRPYFSLAQVASELDTLERWFK